MRDITLKMTTGQKLNIRVDERQSIQDTLNVLTENGKIHIPGELRKIFSRRRGKYINVLLSYKQAEIYNGDILEIKNI